MTMCDNENDETSNSWTTKTGSIDSVIPNISSNGTALVPVEQQYADWWDTSWGKGVIYAKRHQEKCGNIKENMKIFFIGDSITEMWDGDAWNAITSKYGADKVVNLGFGGDTTQNVIWRMENGAFPAGMNPEYVVLMIGTNNQINNQNEIAAGIGKIVKIINSVSHNTKIVLLSVLPRDDDSSFNMQKIKIEGINSILKKYEGYINIIYIDLYPLFLNEAKNNVNTKLLNDDKLHVAQAGYVVMKDELIKVIK